MDTLIELIFKEIPFLSMDFLNSFLSIIQYLKKKFNFQLEMKTLIQTINVTIFLEILEHNCFIPA